MKQELQKTKVKKINITKDDAGQRIDNFILRKYKSLPRSKVYRILRRGEVRINSGRVSPSYKIKENDELRMPPVMIRENTESPSLDQSERILDFILYEDKEILIIDKPAGIAVHGGSGVKFGVIELIRAARSDQNNLELIHRIDRETSGCLMLSKKRSFLRFMHEQFRLGAIKKNYFALVNGFWRFGENKIDKPLMTHHRKNSERYVTCEASGKKALTKVKLINQYKDCALIQCQPVTGRTHQIRVHLSELGYPILGDERYGNHNLNMKLKKKGIKRLFLHAQSIGFLDKNGTDRLYTSPIPKDFDDFL